MITKTAIEKSGIVSLTRSNPFAFSYAIGGEVAAAVLQRNAIATMVKVVRAIATVHIISSLPCGEQKGQERLGAFEPLRSPSPSEDESQVGR